MEESRFLIGQSAQAGDSSLARLFTVLLLVALVGGLGFFVYNWWKCRKSRVLEDEYDDDQESFRPQSKKELKSI
jgi:Tfp pilus assembly protein PilO